MRETRVFSVVVAGLALAAGSALAAPAAKPAGKAALAAGQASGTLTYEGKSLKLAHARSFVDTRNQTLLVLLTEGPVPAEAWSDNSFFPYKLEHPFQGILFKFTKGELSTAEIYVGEFPTGTSGYFTVDLKAGTAVAGTARSTPFAESAKEPARLDVRFNAGPRPGTK